MKIIQPIVIFFLLTAFIRAESHFIISFNESLLTDPVDGRLLLLISNNDVTEPRFQITEDDNTQLIFGMDVNVWKPGVKIEIDDRVFGYPVLKISELPSGSYYVQAVLHIYDTFQRGDGHTVKLPIDRGEGQKWNISPGNLYSTPLWIEFDPGADQHTHLRLDQMIPSIEPPKDTKYVRHIRMESQRLSEFWGRPIYLGATILLPQGFEQHPEAQYPLVIFQGHFNNTITWFREEPPDPDLKPDYSKRFNIHGYNKIQQNYAYQTYQDWISPGFPRVIIIEVQHQNPYFDDSYAVNSANLGPYGDAITYDLIPYIEKNFRGIGAGWARFLYGGSTGGWEALAAQVFYPLEYNGCWAACPDPIDFRAYGIVNIYEDNNAYYLDNSWLKTARPARRDYLGRISLTMEQANHLELVLGTRSRSGKQWDIWQAVFSPVGPDGYPMPIWDKLNGNIDPKVATYWRENYDLRFILQRDWPKIGPDLAGKINIYCGDMDNWYLNNAVYLMEEFLSQTMDPPYGGEVDYGDRAEHCWNGDHTSPNAISRLRYTQLFLPKILQRIRISAPAGADTLSWRY